MILTRESLRSAGTLGIGFNRAQLSLLDVPWPLKQGWQSRLIGRTVPDETWEKVMRLRSVRKRSERLAVMRDQSYLPRLF